MIQRLLVLAVVVAAVGVGNTARAGDMITTDSDQKRFVTALAFAFDCASSGQVIDDDAVLADPNDPFEDMAEAIVQCKNVLVTASSSQLSDLELELLFGSGAAAAQADPSGSLANANSTSQYEITFTVDATYSFILYETTIEVTAAGAGFEATVTVELVSDVSGTVFSQSVMTAGGAIVELADYSGLLQPDEVYTFTIRADAIGDVADDAGSALAEYGFKFFTGCDADLDGSGVVDPADIAILLGLWGTFAGGPPDFNDDGVVGPDDLAYLLGNWGPCVLP